MQNIISFFQGFIDASIRIHPIYMPVFLLIALILYFKSKKQEGHQTGFWAWLVPKDIYFHPSHITDLKLFVVGQVMTAVKFLNITAVQTLFGALSMLLVATLTGMDMATQESTVIRIILATIIITISADFCVYWVHRIHHEWPVLWPFHSVHHSAEVMTPITVYRKHPVYDIISGLINAIFIGAIQGVLIVLLIGKIELSLIAGINACYFIFNFIRL